MKGRILKHKIFPHGGEVIVEIKGRSVIILDKNHNIMDEITRVPRYLRKWIKNKDIHAFQLGFGGPWILIE
jgi:hypothetical protein